VHDATKSNLEVYAQKVDECEAAFCCVGGVGAFLLEGLWETVGVDGDLYETLTQDHVR
jgi:hypothetical protein